MPTTPTEVGVMVSRQFWYNILNTSQGIQGITMKTKILTLAAFAAAISIASADEKIILTQFDLSDTASDRGQVRVGAKAWTTSATTPGATS